MVRTQQRPAALPVRLPPKLVVLKLDGDLAQQGFRVTLEVGEEGDRPWLELSGALPPNPELLAHLRLWQQAYRSLGQDTRIIPQEIIYGGSVNPLDDCRRFARQLREGLNAWLESAAFRPLDRRLRETLNPDEIIRLLVRSPDRQIQRLPWQSWDLLERYPKAELALAVPTLERLTTVRSRGQHRVRILAILGHRTGINVTADRAILEQLPNAEVTFLVEPPRQQMTQQLWDQPWDVLFFAGHSQTEGNQGRIYLNPQESLTLEELKYGLRQAIAQGLQLAIFNSCDGLGLAEELAQLHLPQMIVMREPVPDPVAQAFLKQFVIAFAAGESLYLAARQARERLQGLEADFPCASWLPVICQHSPDPPPDWQMLAGQTTALPVPERPANRPAPWSMRSSLLTSTLLTLMILALRWWGGLQPAELWAFDLLLRLRPSEGLDQRLLIVKATEQDFQKLQEYPLSDRTVFKLLKKLNQYQPHLIGLDLYRDIPQGQGRKDLLQHLKTGDRIITACKLPDQQGPGIAPPPGIPADFLGATDVVVDAQGVIRRQLLSVSPKPGNPCATGYTLNFLLASYYLLDKGYAMTQTAHQDWQLGQVTLPRLRVPTGGYAAIDASGSQILLNYRSPVEVAQQVTVTQVLADPNPDYIRDRIVLIGVDTEGQDRYATPYSQGTSQTVAGVIIQAQMLSQLLSAVLDRRPLLWTWPVWGEGLWILGWALGGGLVAVGWRWAFHGNGLLYWGLASGTGLLILGGVSFGLILQGGWIPIVPPAIVFVMTSAGGMLHRTLRESSLLSTAKPD
jgi:CHASE2 domain-containing sensor protein